MADSRPDHLTWRLRLLAALVALSLVALLGRLAQIQIVDHAKYGEEAALTHQGVDSVPAARGAILDATGFPLATSIDTWDVYIDSFLWQQQDAQSRVTEAAAGLADALKLDARSLLTSGTGQ